MPHTTLVFCDIEKPLERHCATAIEKATGVRLNAAAVALVAGQSGGNIGLDESPEARARCGGEPEADGEMPSYAVVSSEIEVRNVVGVLMSPAPPVYFKIERDIPKEGVSWLR